MHKPPEILLGVNIDHVATLRQSRNTLYPEPIQAALLAEQAGADAITLHLREDRRHIQERDVEMISKVVQTRINLEMAVTDEMVALALKYKPSDCCLVPERREELTTEGGLDVVSNLQRITQVCSTLAQADIRVSLFIDADPAQILAAVESGAPVIEIHTGHFADANTPQTVNKELEKVIHGVQLARDNGLVVNAGHGLHYHNVRKIAAIQEVSELNIGHAIIAEALMTGLASATKEMKRLMLEARQFGW